MLVVLILSAEFAIIAALLVLLIVREVRGQYMDRRRLWGVPLILAIVGVIYLPLTVQRVVPADLALTAVAVLIAIVVGLGLGALTTVSRATQPDRRGRVIRTRSGWRGGALWLAFIAARLALQPAAASWNASLVTSPGVVLLLVAIARATAAVLVAPKLAAATHSDIRSAD